jgi:hypothetical protein
MEFANFFNRIFAAARPVIEMRIHLRSLDDE